MAIPSSPTCPTWAKLTVRLMAAPYGGGKGLNFDALIQTYEAKEGKKGRKEIRFTTTNDEDSYTYHLTIYPDGTTQIRIQPTRRQSISFNGKMDTDE